MPRGKDEDDARGEGGVMGRKKKGRKLAAIADPQRTGGHLK